MSVMFEVYCKPPKNTQREASLTEFVSQMGGQLDYSEDATDTNGIVLTYEFPDWNAAEKAADLLRQNGEHVEGPMDYGE